MKRRDLLLGLSAASLSGCGLFGGSTQLGFSLAKPTEVRIDTRKRGAALRDDMLGLSFDTSTLAQSRFFSAESRQLIGLLNGLGQHGVIRLGRPSTDQGVWLPNGGKLPKPYHYSLTTSDIDRFAKLIDSSGWSLIYGLDLAHGDPARAAVEAAYVHSRIGKRVLAFELGNAPDRYVQEKLRPAAYDATAACAEWKRYAAALRAQIPDVPLAGPDAGNLGSSAWTEAFIRTCGDDLQLVTAQADGHEARQPQNRYSYGALGGRIFGLSNEQEAALNQIAATAHQAQLPCRISQARAVEQGQSVDTLGAALWAIDLFYQRCGNTTAPWAGICLHDVLHLNAAGSDLLLRSGPLYYALRLLALTLPSQRVDSSVIPPPTPAARKSKQAAHTVLRSHALLDHNQHLQLVLINPDGNDSIDVRVNADRSLRNGNILRLIGADLGAASGITLASGTTDALGDWRPLYTDTAQTDGGDAYLTVSAGSAVLVQFD